MKQLFDHHWLDLMPDILKERPQLDLSTDTIIVVDNAPKVKPDRLSKLETVLTRVFSKFGTVLSQFHPTDDDDVTKGSVDMVPRWLFTVDLIVYILFQYCCCCYFSYFFMEFANKEQTEQAVKAGNGYKLDKSHVFVVNHFSDFEK